jgi:hypothetical protein
VQYIALRLHFTKGPKKAADLFWAEGQDASTSAEVEKAAMEHAKC